MTPTAELIYSHDYAQRLYRGEKPFTEVWQELIFRGEVFERVFDEVAPTILKTISDVTGYDWPENLGVIPVYLVTEGRNIVAPLTLTVTDDPEQMLYDLIGLLVRSNVRTGFPTEQKRDAAIHALVREVALRGKINLEDAIAETDLQLREQYGMEFEIEKWDLHKHPARHYVEK